jgi:hypothetical protein
LCILARTKKRFETKNEFFFILDFENPDFVAISHFPSLRRQSFLPQPGLPKTFCLFLSNLMKPLASASVNYTVRIVIAIAIALAPTRSLIPVSVSAMVVLPNCCDTAMEATYDRLAKRAIDLYHSGKGTGLGGRCWIGIAGGPGAGKSTLAAAVADKICELESRPGSSKSSIQAVAIPMDGYHYTRAKLASVTQALGGDIDDGTKGMSRRGAPWTFDANALARDLGAAKSSGHASLPEYDRVLSDPVEDAVVVEESHQIVLVEGNYLILGLLRAEVEPTDNTNTPLPASNLEKACDDLLCPIPIGEEIRRWRDVAALWDETWFVAPPGSTNAVETQRDRIIERSLETWNPSKTKAWGGKTDREAAIKRAEFNDVRNARLVECCRGYADLVVDSI